MVSKTEIAVKVSSKWRLRRALYWQKFITFWKEFSKSRIGLIGLGILFFFAFVAIFAPQLAPYDPFQRNPLSEDGKWDPTIYPEHAFNPPMEGHRFGTDYLNRDIFSEVIYGTRISLTIGLLAASLVVGIGTLMGLVAGFMGGIIDDILMRLTDLVLIMPMLPLMIVLSMVLGRGMYNIVIVIGILVWPSTARMVRASTLSLRERGFVEASRSVGASRFRLIFVHILPNVIPLVFATMVLQIGGAILTEASLSFLGIGDPTSFSWGKILFDAFDNQALVLEFWWYLLPPGICISLVVLGFIFFSYGLDRVVNPRLRIERWSDKALDQLFEERN